MIQDLLYLWSGFIVFEVNEFFFYENEHNYIFLRNWNILLKEFTEN